MKDPEQSNKPVIALFDFDGTLTTKDSFFKFLEFTNGKAALVTHFLYLWPLLLLYKLKVISNSSAKKIVFRQFYKNWPFTFFQEKATVFAQKIIPKMLNPAAIEKLKWHQKQGHRVVIVSAMFEPVLQDWCIKNKTELLATGLEIKNNKLTGNFSTPNCYGKEKVKRIKKAGLLKNQPFIYAYGDSEGDQPMLKIANQPFYRSF